MSSETEVLKSWKAGRRERFFDVSKRYGNYIILSNLKETSGQNLGYYNELIFPALCGEKRELIGNFSRPNLLHDYRQSQFFKSSNKLCGLELIEVVDDNNKGRIPLSLAARLESFAQQFLGYGQKIGASFVTLTSTEAQIA